MSARRQSSLADVIRRMAVNHAGEEPASCPSLRPGSVEGSHVRTKRTLYQQNGYTPTADAVRYWADLREVAPTPIVKQPDCAFCGGCGYVRRDYPVGHPCFGRLFPCPDPQCAAAQANQAAHHQRLMTYSHVPSGYAPLTFETFDALSPSAQAGKWVGRYAAQLFVEAAEQNHFVNRRLLAARFGEEAADDWRNSLMLYGMMGRGKTGIAAAILNALKARGLPMLYIRVPDAIESIQKRYAKAKAIEGYGDDFGDDTAEEVLERYKTAPVLWMDEFTIENPQADKQRIIEAIMRYRMGERKPTVATTNFSPRPKDPQIALQQQRQGVAFFDDHWSPRTWVVMREAMHWIEMKGDDLRPDVGRMDWEVVG